MRSYILLALLLLSFAIGYPAGSASAQFGIPSTSGGIGGMLNPQAQISIVSDVDFPEPFETIELSVDDYSINTVGATISWFVDEVEQPDFRNSRTLPLTVGDIGKTTHVIVRLEQVGGQIIEATRSFSPTRLDIIVEAETIVPAHYRGRSLPSPGSIMRVVALLEADIPTEELSYTWSLGSTVLFNGPVTGKNIARIIAPDSQETALISLTVAHNGRDISQRTFEVRLTPTEILFYEDNPLRGLNREIISNPFNLLAEETVIRAEPYYFPFVAQGDILFEWKIDGRDFTNPSLDPLNLTLRREGTNGRFNVDFHIRNLTNLFQGNYGDFTVTF